MERKFCATGDCGIGGPYNFSRLVDRRGMIAVILTLKKWFKTNGKEISAHRPETRLSRAIRALSFFGLVKSSQFRVRSSCKVCKHSPNCFLCFSQGRLIVSSSDGYLSLLGCESNGNLSVLQSWFAHDYEPWIAAWNYWDTNICYSGTAITWSIIIGYSPLKFLNSQVATILKWKGGMCDKTLPIQYSQNQGAVGVTVPWPSQAVVLTTYWWHVDLVLALQQSKAILTELTSLR